MIVFGPDYRTAPGHIYPQASARRLLDGGPVAIALAPAGLSGQGDVKVKVLGAVGEDVEGHGQKVD